MSEYRLILRALLPHAGVPLRHVPRLGGVEAKAEAEADLAFLRQRARHQRFFARGDTHRMHMHVR